MIRYNIVPVTNKPKLLTRNLENEKDQIATNCLSTWRFFQFYLDGGRSTAGIP